MKKILFATLAMASMSGAFAQNPIISTWFTPDPAPYVHNDKLYLFVDHDEDDAQYFKMKDWMLYSTTDMVNWTYRGTPISTATFGWATQGDKAWASQAIERNGKWYWYICAQDAKSGMDAIGVAVADSPSGPYKDPLGKPLSAPGFGYIDPSVFIDDDGQAYLFWGNNGLWYARLNDDMVSFDGDVIEVTSLNDENAFGPLVMKQDYRLNKRMLKTNYEEGPWVFKRNGTYYLVYAAGGVPEHMAYSTSDNINGPWKYGGRIMDEAEKSFTIHGGSVNFKGRDFMFYHNGMLPNGDGFRRASCVEEFKFNDDGSIPHIPFTRHGVATPAGTLDPYKRVEAETMASGFGLKTDRKAGDDHYLTSINNGDWLRLRAVDFGDRVPRHFKACVGTAKEGSAIQLRLDALSGPVIATVNIVPTGGVDKYQLQSAEIVLPKGVDLSGVHDVYMLFQGGEGELFDFDYWTVE